MPWAIPCGATTGHRRTACAAPWRCGAWLVELADEASPSLLGRVDDRMTGLFLGTQVFYRNVVSWVF